MKAPNRYITCIVYFVAMILTIVLACTVNNAGVVLLCALI